MRKYLCESKKFYGDKNGFELRNLLKLMCGFEENQIHT